MPGGGRREAQGGDRFLADAQLPDLRRPATLGRVKYKASPGALSDHGYAVLRGQLHAELDRLLAGTYTDPDNARLAKLLRKHRDSVLRFLDHDGVDATNNLAEREGRPAALARKLSAGERTQAGGGANPGGGRGFPPLPPPGPRKPPPGAPV